MPRDPWEELGRIYLVGLLVLGVMVLARSCIL